MASLCHCPWVCSSPSWHPCMEFPPLLAPAWAPVLLCFLAWHPSPGPCPVLVAAWLQMSWAHPLNPLNPLFGCPGLGCCVVVALAQGLRCCCWILAGKPHEGEKQSCRKHVQKTMQHKLAKPELYRVKVSFLALLPVLTCTSETVKSQRTANWEAFCPNSPPCCLCPWWPGPANCKKKCMT